MPQGSGMAGIGCRSASPRSSARTAGATAAGDGLMARGLRKRYGDVVALDGADLRVRPGRLVGFLGPNGAGKTTAMRAILRLVALDGGSITWNGLPVGEQQRRRIGYMPQERGLYLRMSAHAHIAYVGRLAGMDAAAAGAAAGDWLERVGLADRGGDVVESLSVGNQQRVQLCVALVNDPDLLILDEPFGGLDPVAVAALAAILAERAARGAAVVFSSHQLDLVQDLCEDVTIIAGGVTVAAGTVAELRSQAARRIVRIAWEDPTVRWTPPEGLAMAGDGAAADRTATTGRDRRATPGRVRFVVPAGADPAEIAAAAAAAGRVTTFSIEPPSLDEVFVELVTGEHPRG